MLEIPAIVFTGLVVSLLIALFLLADRSLRIRDLKHDIAQRDITTRFLAKKLSDAAAKRIVERAAEAALRKPRPVESRLPSPALLPSPVARATPPARSPYVRSYEDSEIRRGDDGFATGMAVGMAVSPGSSGQAQTQACADTRAETPSRSPSDSSVYYGSSDSDSSSCGGTE